MVWIGFYINKFGRKAWRMKSREKQEMSTIRSQQEQILTTQTQHTTILRQLQHHLGLPSTTEHLIPTTTKPHTPRRCKDIHLSHQISSIILPISNHLHTLLYVFPLWNPIFLVLYSGIACMWTYIALYYFNSSTHIFYCFFLSMWFLLYNSDFTPLRRYHFLLIFNRHIEDNVQLGWGESWGRKFLLLMLSYFGNLVAFYLILKFLSFYSTLLGY